MTKDGKTFSFKGIVYESITENIKKECESWIIKINN